MITTESAAMFPDLDRWLASSRPLPVDDDDPKPEPDPDDKPEPTIHDA